MQRLQNEGVQCFEWREPDLDDQLTAVATEPIYGDTRRLFKRFQLLDRKPKQLLKEEI